MKKLPNWLDEALRKIDNGEVTGGIVNQCDFEPSDLSLGLFYDKKYDSFDSSEYIDKPNPYSVKLVDYSDFDDESVMFFTFWDWRMRGKNEGKIFIELPEQLQQYLNPIYEGAYNHV